MDRRSKGYLMVAAAIALVAVGVAVWALFFRDPFPGPSPGYRPSGWKTTPCPRERMTGQTAPGPGEAGR